MADKVFKLMGRRTEGGESFLVKSSRDEGELINLKVQLECSEREKDYWIEAEQQ